MYRVYRALKEVVSSKLLLMTTLACFDGNILSLSASGAISDPSVIIVTALTCIAGVGAWTAAIEEYVIRRKNRKYFVLTALISISLVSITCYIGAIIGLTFNGVMKYFSSLAVLTIALQILGLIPETRIPIPIGILAFGITVEVILWML